MQNKKSPIISTMIFLFVAIASAGYTVTYPNGGETVRIGDTITVTWNATLDMYECWLSLSTDNGKTYNHITSKTIQIADTASWSFSPEDTLSKGHYKWVIPDSLNSKSIVSTQCRISIKPYNANASAEGYSDNTFTIAPRTSSVKWFQNRTIGSQKSVDKEVMLNGRYAKGLTKKNSSIPSKTVHSRNTR